MMQSRLLLTRRAFLETSEDFSGPKSYVMRRMFTNIDSVFVAFES